MTDADHIATLDPALQPLAAQHLAACNARWRERGLPSVTKIVQSFRTPEYQTELYAQGRTAPGPIVTHALPEQAPHCRRGAYDALIVEHGVTLTLDKSHLAPEEYARQLALYQEQAALARSLGLVCGIDWKMHPDSDHYELQNWRDLSFPPVTPTV